MLTTVHLPDFVKLLLAVLCCSSLLACQPSDRPVTPETSPINTNTKTEVDLNQLCEQLNTEMQQVDHQRTLLALQQINQDLKVCLPLMSTEEQLALLNISHDMYDKFLWIERSPSQQIAFEQYVNGTGTHPTLRQQNFEQMTLRDQYLVKHQGQGYVEVITLNDGHVGYRRSPQYLARIFAPYLPEAEQSFINALANQNTQPLFNDQSLKVEPLVVAERALFWENYLNQYPQSRYKNDAQYLYQAYSQLLFTGTQQNKVSDNYSGSQSIDPQSLAAIEYVSQQANSQIANQATKFLSFIQRTTHTTEHNLEQEHQMALSDLENELGLVPVNFKRSKNCFADAVCI